MPAYQIKSPDGNTITVKGDRPPTQEEAAALFAQATEPEKEPEQATSTFEAITEGAAESLTFGFKDEIAAMLAGLAGGDPGAVRSSMREHSQAVQAEHPYAYTGGMLAGGVVPGALGASAVSRMPALASRPVAGLAAVGAGEGGLYGAGMSEEETLPGVLADTGFGALVGGVAAPVGGAVLEGATRALSGVGRALWRKVASSPKDVALREVRRSLAADRITRDEAEAIMTDHPELVLADLGENVRALGRLSANQPGVAMREGADALNARQYGQQARLHAAARETVGDKWGGYYDFIDNLTAARKAQAGPAYAEAFEVGIQPTAQMVRISKTRAFQDAAKEAQAAMGNKLDLMGPGGVDASGQVSTRFMDQIKRRLDARIRTLQRAGDNEGAADIINIKKAFVDELDAQNPRYAEARGIFSGAKDLEDAADLGRGILKGNKTSQDIQREMAGFTEGEMEAFRVGALDGIMRQVQLAGGTHDAVKRLVNSTRARDVIRTAFPDEAAYNQFLNTMDAEAMMTATRNSALGGSRTAPMLMQEQALQEGAGMAGAIAGDIATQGAPGVQTGVRMFQKLIGEPVGPDEYEEITKLLFSHLPPDARNRLWKKVVSGAPPQWPETVGRIGGAATVPAVVQTRGRLENR